MAEYASRDSNAIVGRLLLVKHPRILVLRGGAIGDFIVTLPVLQALRDRWPDGYIELVGYPRVTELASAAGLVHHTSSLDQAGIARFFALKPMFTPEQREWIASFDIVLNYLNDPDGSLRENLSQAGARLLLCGSPLVERGHAVDHLVRPLESLAIYASGAVPRLRIPKRADEGIIIHPGSGSPKKNWPLERFLDLARRLNRNVRFLVGEADEDVSARLSGAAPDIPVIREPSLTSVATILAGSSGYIGNDSGITHLAAAVGAPVVALFGPSDPNRWGPRGDYVHILRAPGGTMSALDLEEVARVVASSNFGSI